MTWCAGVVRMMVVGAALLTASTAGAEMIAYYPFDNALSDSSPNAYHLSMNNAGPDFSSSIKIAGSHSFRMNFAEGNNFDFHPHRVISSMPKLTSATARKHMTITAWFRSTDEFASWRSILSTANSSGSDAILYMTQKSDESRVWADFVDSNNVAVGSQANFWADPGPTKLSAVNQWQFIAMTWDGENTTPFRPGRADIYTARLGATHLQHLTNEWTSGLMRQHTDPTTAFFSLGGVYSADTFTNGFYDELAIWDETLTASNITNIFRLNSAGITVPEPAALALLAPVLAVFRRGRRRR